MVNKKIIIAVIMGFLFLFHKSAHAAGQTFYVNNNPSASCSNSTSSGSLSKPFCTIVYGAAHIGGGDTLIIRAGTYNETPVFSGPAGTAAQPTVIAAAQGEQVIIQGPGVDGGRVKFADTSYMTLDGVEVTNFNQGIFIDSSDHITLQNNKVYLVGQEGIHVRMNSSYITIQDNTVHDTRQWQFNGEGIYLGTGSSGPLDNTNHVTVKNNLIYNTNDEGIELKPGTHDFIIENNTIYNAGTGFAKTDNGRGIEFERQLLGVQIYNANPNHIIRNNIIHDLSGTAIRVGSGSTVYNNVIYNISAGYGINSQNPDADSYQRDIYHNTIDMTAANAVHVTSGTADIRNNIGPSSAGNLAANSGYFVNRTGNDYHLVAGSAPVDAGADLTSVVTTDIEGNTRTNPPDLGAYEYNSGGSNSTPVSGDINLDHIVNSIDYSILNSDWFTNDSTSDLNHDGIVNAIDYSILNSNWFKTW